MRKHIKAQTIKMVIVFGFVLFLVAWQFEFVWTGLNSNLYLNGTIVLTYLFGVMTAFRSVLGLKNEEYAFSSLQEAYQDVRAEQKGDNTDPYWRHYRCLEPATVFVRPKILGHIYEITMEELLRTRHISVSVSTMQNLVRGIDTRLADERSLLSYVTGILVFLGLIGTFIGLMAMVKSVGGIIGGLAGGGGGDPAAAFSKLITDLQAPLVGMATGFSSSLFGLFGSLTLGLMSRFGNQATGVLKTYFEAWLAGVAQIEKDDAEAARGEYGTARGNGRAAGAGDAAANAAAESVTAVAVTRSIGRATTSFDNATGVLRQMADMQTEQRELFRQAAESLKQLVTSQEELKSHLGHTVSLGAAVEGARGDIARIGQAVETRVSDRIGEISDRLEIVRQGADDGLGQLMRQNSEIAARLALLGENGGSDAELAKIGTALEKGVATGFTGMQRALEVAARAQAEALKRLASHQVEIRTILESRAAGAPDQSELRNISEAIEASISRGFGDVAHSFESAFSAYAGILKTVAVVEEQAAEPHPSDGAAALAPWDEMPDTETDYEEMARRLYATAASRYARPAGDAD